MIRWKTRLTFIKLLSNSHHLFHFGQLHVSHCLFIHKRGVTYLLTPLCYVKQDGFVNEIFRTTNKVRSVAFKHIFLIKLHMFGYIKLL